MFYVLHFVRDFLKQNKLRYFLGSITVLIEDVMVVLPTYLIGKLIDAWIDGSLSSELVKRYFIYMIIILVVGYVSEVAWTYLIFGTSQMYNHDVKKRLVRLFLRRRSIFYERFSSGDLMTRTTQDSMYVSDMLGWGVEIVVASGFYALVLLFMMFTQADTRLVLLSMLPYLLYFYLISKNSVKVERLWQEQQEAFSKLNDSVLEGVEGLRNIRAYAKDELFRQRFEQKTSELCDMNCRLAIYTSAYGPSSYLAAIVTTLLSLGVGSYFVQSGSMTMGQLITFQVYLSSFVGPVGQFGEFFNLLQNANNSARRLNDLFTSTDKMEDAEGMPEHFEQLRAQNYRFRYPSSEKDNLSAIEFELKPGKTLGIVGKTGSGKTTLIRQLQRQFPAGEGDFFINGEKLSELRPDGLNKIISFVEQDTMVFSGSIRDNLRFAAPEASDETLLEALHMAGFDMGTERMKEGLDTVIGEQGITLSGGQRQRVTIARALLTQPEVLVIDDALSAVDAETESKILSRLAKLREGKANIISAHRLSSVENADEILVLDKGKIFDRGTHQELIAREGWYREQAILQNMNVGPLAQPSSKAKQALA